MVNITKTCQEFLNMLSDNRTKEQLLMNCASDRLSNLYLRHSEKLDKTLSELVNCIDMDDIDYTGRVLKRLNNCLKNNRDQLIYLIERMC